MKKNIYKTVLNDDVYYFENSSIHHAYVTKDPTKAWNFNHYLYYLYDIRTDYSNYIKLDLEQFVLMSQKVIVEDYRNKLNIDYTEFRLKHIISLYPLVLEDFDASSEEGIIKEYGTAIP